MPDGSIPVLSEVCIPAYHSDQIAQTAIVVLFCPWVQTIKTLWFLMHRIWALMGKRDDQYPLTGMIEFDEGFFEIATPEKERKKPQTG